MVKAPEIEDLVRELRERLGLSPKRGAARLEVTFLTLNC